MNRKSPTINALGRTNKFKLARITSRAGSEIPLHSSKEEIIILVQNGKGILEFNNTIVVLEKNSCKVIPAFSPHTLKISKDFEALVIMGNDVFFDFYIPTETLKKLAPSYC